MAALMLVMGASAKIKITVNQEQLDGSHVVIASEFNAYFGFSTGANMNLAAVVSDVDGVKICQYFLQMKLSEGYTSINKGDKLLIKLDDNEVLELEATDNFRYDAFTNFTTPQYYISEQQLLQMASNDVVKLRIQTGEDFLDRAIVKGKVSKGIKESMPLVKTCLENSKGKNLYSDF